MSQPIILSSHIQDTLEGQLLIATSQISEGFFKQSVIYICSHDVNGAVGIVVNKPMEGVSINDVFAELRMNIRIGDRKLPLLAGGPVAPYRGFLIHNGTYNDDTTIVSRDDITITSNTSTLTAWLEGEFAAKMVLALGYAGWSAGQLEAEIEMGSWVSTPATQALLFDTAPELQWDVAVSYLGFDLSKLYMAAGHA